MSITSVANKVLMCTSQWVQTVPNKSARAKRNVHRALLKLAFRVPAWGRFKMNHGSKWSFQSETYMPFRSKQLVQGHILCIFCSKIMMTRLQRHGVCCLLQLVKSCQRRVACPAQPSGPTSPAISCARGVTAFLSGQCPPCLIHRRPSIDPQHPAPAELIIDRTWAAIH